MPCLNEEQTVRAAIEATLKALDTYEIRGEIILVNDGSTDKSLAIAKDCATTDSRVVIIDHHENKGIGSSFSTGVTHASKSHVVFIPADNENDLAEVLRYHFLLTNVDVLVPFIYNPEKRNITRRLLSAIYRFIINISFGTTFSYTNGTIVYNRKALTSTTFYSKGFFYQTEILIKLSRMGFLHAEVPLRLNNQPSRASKALTLKSFTDIVSSFTILFFKVHLLRTEGRTTDIRHLPPASATHRRYYPADQN